MSLHDDPVQLEESSIAIQIFKDDIYERKKKNEDITFVEHTVMGYQKHPARVGNNKI
jgi:hypothetical protein